MSGINRESLEIIADHIGSPTTPDQVHEVIEFGIEHTLLFRGLSRINEHNNAMQNGFTRLSHWGRGTRLFWSDKPSRETAMWAYSSVFFDYAHAHNPGGPKTWLMAIISEAKLAEIGVKSCGAEGGTETTLLTLPNADAITWLHAQSEEGFTNRDLFDHILAGARSGTLLDPGQQCITSYHDSLTV